MSNGAGKYLESLNPVAYYTFDDADTVNSDGTYFFINKSPYEFPFLQSIITSIDGYRTKDNPTSYSLSLVEKTAKYRSYSSAEIRQFPHKRISYTYVPQTQSYIRNHADGVFNSISKPLNADLDPDIINLVGTKYTILMQFKVYDMKGTHSLGLLHRENLSTLNENGDPIIPLDLNGLPIDMSTARFFPYQIPLRDNHVLCESFRFLDVAFVVDYNTEESSVIKLINPNGNIFHSFSATNEDIYSLAITVDTTRKEMTFRFDTNESSNTVVYVTQPDITRQTLKIGFTTRYIDMVTPSYLSIGYRDNGTLSTLYASRYNIHFDNVAVFNRHLTVSEIRRYHALNIDIKTQYGRIGFTELYDFNQYHDPESINHIETNNVLTSIIGGVNRSLCPSSDEPYSGFTVNRYIGGNIEYSLNFSKKSMLYDMPYFNISNPYRFIKNQEFSVSFFFKTSDNNGLLYSYSRTIVDSKNLMFYFKNGALQIWMGTEVVQELSGYNNGEFHHLIIVNTSGRCSIYMNTVLVYSGNGVYDGSSLKYSVFGNGLPQLIGLKFELALLAYATKAISSLSIFDIHNNTLIYESTGIITLNNIRVGTTILIYDHHSGRLIEKLKSGSIDGIFRYANRYPYTITVVVNDDMMLNGKSYIVSPVEIT